MTSVSCIRPLFLRAVKLLAQSCLRVLYQIHGLILKSLDEHIEQAGHYGSENRSHPVDPMVGVEGLCNDCWSERSCRIDTTTSIKDAHEFSNEKGETDANWSDKGSFVLLGSKHEDRENKLSS
jgi:hypothetical protein